MREFEPPVSPELRAEIIELATKLLNSAPKIKEVYGRDLAMENEDAVVSRSAKIPVGDEGGTMTVAISEENARPPFEWIAEITSEIEETEYLKHYLVRENDMVLAHRKVITEVDDVEAKELLVDMIRCNEFMESGTSE